VSKEERKTLSQDIDGRLFDLAVNKVITLLQEELLLKPFEMVAVTKTAYEHLSKVFDIQIQTISESEKHYPQWTRKISAEKLD
jgi:hypothetical protein